MKRALAFLVAVAIGAAAWAENPADSFWAGPGGVGDWGGPNWYYTLRNGNSYFTEGKTAYFTNETSVIDLGGRTFDVYTLRTPLANGERVSVTVTNGTLSLVYPVASSDDEDVFNLRNIDLVGGAGANIVNSHATSGFQLLRSSGITLKDGGTLTETSSDQSTMRFNVGYNGENGSSNYLYIAKGSSLDTGRTIQIGGSNSETLHPTGVVEVAGGSLSALAIWVAYVDGASASGGYGALIVKDGGQVVSRSQFLMGTDYVNGNDIYRGVSEVVVTGEGSSLEIGTPQTDYNLTVREYGTKNILVDNGGRLTVYGNIRNYADNANIHAFDIMVGNGGVLEFKNISFSNHNSGRMDMKGQGKCSFTVDGGTTRALASFTTATANGDGALHAVTVGENGWTFDTQNFDVIWARTINFGTGTFTKTGSGYFEFNWVPTFTGTIDVSEGMVGLAGSSAKFPGAITVRSGAAFKKTVEFSSEQDATFTLEAGSILQPYQSSSSAAPVAIKAQSFTLPETGVVKIRLGDSGANTAPAGAHPLVTILGEGVFNQDDLAKFVCMSGDAVKSLELSADGKSIVLSVASGSSRIWTGTAGDGLFSNPVNWAGGVKPTVGDTTPIVFASNGGAVTNDIGNLSPAWIEFGSGAGGIEISGANGFTGVAAITNLSSSSVSLDVPVAFASTYRVHCANDTGFVNFTGGATATYPDAAITSDNLGSHTLCGDITFTQNWTIPDQSSGKPFVIPDGANVKGKTVAANAYNNANYHLRIENGGTGTFETIAVDGKLVFLLQEGGRLVATGDVTLGGADKRDFGYYNAANSGVLEAHGIYKSVTGVGLIYHYMRNMRVGAGGFGMYRKDYSIQFCADSRLTATDDLAIHQPIAGDKPKDGDWGLNLYGKTFTIDTAGHTVTFDSAIHGTAGKIVKEGEGEMIMQSRAKNHNNTEVKGGTLTMKLTSAAGNGPISVASGATLKMFSASVTLPGALTMAGGSTLAVPTGGAGSIGTSFKVTGEGNVTIKVGDGTETLSAGQKYDLFTVSGTVTDALLSRLVLENPTEGGASYNFNVNSAGIVSAYIGNAASPYANTCLWTGSAGDGKFSTAANWQGGRRPQDVGSTAAVFFNYGGGEITNDVDNLSIASITFGRGVTDTTIHGKTITVSGALELNDNATVSPVFKAKIYSTQSVVTFKQPAMGYETRTNKRMVFDGGLEAAPGSSPSTGSDSSRAYFGHYEYPSATTKFTANQQGSGGRRTSIEAGSSVTVDAVGNINELCIVSGGALTTAVYNVANRVSWQVDGEMVVTDTMTFSSSQNLSWSSGANIKAQKVVLTGANNAKICSSNGAYTYNFYVGSGGIEFASGATGYLDLDKASTVFNLHPWKYDFTIGTKGTSTQDIRLNAGSSFTFNTDDEDGIGRNITVDSLISGGVAMNVKGSGSVRFNNAGSTYSGAVTVSGTASVAYGAGAKHGTGAITFNTGTRLAIADASATTTLGAVTLNGDTVLAIGNLSSSVTPLAVSSIAVKGNALLFIEGETPLADGDYTILTAGSDLDASVAGNFSLGGSAVAGKAASLSVDGANLVLTVAGEGLPAAPFHVWTGAGADANFSTAANWQSGAAPQAGDGKGIFFQSSTGTLVNDIPGLTPPWITFGAGIGETTIAGVNGFTDILAVTNLSTAANATFAVPVAYAAGRTIEVDHRAEFNNDTGAYTREKGAVVFAGGVTGEEIRSYQSNGLKSGPHNVYAGQYMRTSDTPFQATLGGSHWRSVIYPGSSLTVKSSTKTGELDIGAGGAFTTGVATITSDSNLNALAYRMGEDSEVVVTERVETSGTGDRMMWRGGSKKAVFKVNGFLQSMTGNWLYLADNNIEEQYGVFYVGPDGFNFSSSSAGGAFALGRAKSTSRNTMRPWTNDFTVATRGTSEKDFVFNYHNTVCTDDENGIGRKITFNAIPQFSYATDGSVTTISGSGTFEVNSAVVNNASYNVEHIVVTNTATLAFGNSAACFTRGPMTMAAGTTLAVPGGVYGASITLGSTLSVVGDGKVKLVIGDGSGLAAGDYGVCVVTGGITAEDAAASFALQNATAGVAEFYIVNGAEVRLSVGGKRLSSVWTGAGDGVHFNNAANWSPAFVPENGSELVFPSGSGALVNDISGFAPKVITFGAGIGETTISGNAISGVLAVTNLSESVQTFSNEVAFAGVYRAYCASDTGFVKFPGGATASYPDASLRTTTGTIASRTLDGNFTFTADWTIGNVGNDNYPWIVASGANVTGKALTGTEERQMFQVDEGGYACFTTVAVGKTKGNISVNGTLEATESISVGVSGQHANFGKSGDTGTVKAPVIHKVDGYSVYCFIPNLIVGSGGIGAAHKDYVWQFEQDTTIVATNDFEFLGMYNSGNAKDWGFGFMGNIVTVDVPEGKSVEFGVSENGSVGVLRKTGAGTLVMSDTYGGQSGFVKGYTGGTTVEGGTLKVLANGMPASGTVTFHAGTTLAVPGDAAVALGTTLAFAGEGTVGLVVGDGSELADGDYPVLSTTEMLPVGSTVKFTVQTPTASEAALYSTDGKTLRLAVGNASYTGPKVWTGAAGDGKLATAGNWLLEKVPVSGDDIVIDAISAGTIDNDLNIAVKSITFKPTTAPVTIAGDAFTGIAAITNLSTATVTFTAPVTFAGTYSVVKSGAVVFAGGATATYPDASQRTSSSSDLNRTLSGSFTFTGDWSVPDIGNYDKPWIVPSGSEVHGKLLTGTQTSRRRILQIENNASAHFTVMTNGWSIGDIDVNGTLEVDGEVVVKTLSGSDGWSNFGTSGNTGTVKAGKFAKINNSYVYSRIPNLVVGAGGIGSIIQDWAWRFYSDTTIKTGDSDFEFLGVYRSASTSDWGVFLASVVTLTIDVGEGRTVTMGAGVYGDGGGAVRKTGAGTLVMSNTYNGQSGFTKSYTNGTKVEEGTLKVLPNGMPASGTVTFYGGTTLAVPGDAAVALGSTLSIAGEGKVNVSIGDGSALADGDYLVATVTGGIACDVATSFALANPNGGNVHFYSTDGKTLCVAVGENAYAGPCVWTGEAGDGKFSTAGNWVAGKVPSDGAAIVFNAMERSAVENDLGELQIDSVTFGAKCSNVGISGGAFTGVRTVANLSGATQFFYVPVVFGNDGDAAIDVTLSSASAFVGFVGGVKGTAPANHTVYSGKYTLTAAEWTPLANSTLKENSTIDAKKLLTPPTTALTIEKGAVVDAEEFEAVNNGADTRASNKNSGTFKIGTLTASRSAKSDLYLVNDASGTGIFEIGKIVQNGTWFFRINSDVAVGEGGLEFNSGDYCITITGNKMYPAAQKVEIKEAEGKSGGYVLLYNAPVTFDTTRYGTADEPAEWVFKRPIKYNSSTGYSQPLNITGCGKVTYSAPLADSTMQGDVNVNDTATLAISAGCKVTTGAMTVAAGATLSAPESGEAAQIGGAATLSDGAILGLKFTNASESPKFAFSSAPTLGGDVYLKIETAAKVVPRNHTGKWTIATGVTGLDVSNFKFETKPTWVEDDTPLVVEGDELVLRVKHPGLVFTVR